MSSRLIWLLSVCVLVCTSLAQTPTGSIEGSVIDPSGAIIPDAKVTIAETATGRVISTTTNQSGLYNVRNLLPGTYHVKVEYSGFSTKEIRDVIVNSGSAVNASVRLEVGKSGEVIEVEAQAIAVDTTRQTIDTIIQSKDVKDLPLFSRNFLDLATIAPGVVVRDGSSIDPTKANGFRTVGIAGRTGTGTRIQIDGIDVTDENVGTSVANISTEALSQFQLTTSSLDISSSLTSSGAVNIITSAGSNQIHGSWFYDYYNQDMGARLQYQAAAAPFDRKRTGGAVSGPAIKDKLFWFANWERTWQTTQIVTTVNAPFSKFNATQGQALSLQNALGRLDWNVTPSARMFYRFSHNNDLSTGGSALSPNQNINNTNIHAIGYDFSKGHATNTIRFGYTNFNNKVNSQELSTPFFRENGTPYRLAIGNLTLGPNGNAPQATYQDNYQISYDGSYVWNKHTFRYGGSFNHIKLGGLAAFANWLTINGTADAGTQAAVAAAGLDNTNPFNYPLNTFTTGSPNGFGSLMGCHGLEHGCHINNRTAVFAGDSWKITRRLTLNVGIRFEYDSGYFNNDPNVKRLPVLATWGAGFDQFPNAPKLWSPSLGFAWDPIGNGKTSIRGGFARAYEMNIDNNIYFDEFVMLPPGIGADNPSFTRVVGPDGAIINVDGRHPTGNYSDLTGQPLKNVIPLIMQVHQAVQAAYRNFKFDPSKGTPALVSLQHDNGGVIPGNQFKPPYSMQFNIGVQRELKAGTVISVDYLYNHGIGLPFLLPDFEKRHDASTLNVAGARTAVNKVLNGLSVDQYIAANPTRTISAFALGGDDVFAGLTPDYQFMRFFQGGFTKFNALQISLRGRVNSDSRFFKGGGYTVSYSRGLSQSSAAVARSEFGAGATDNHNFNNPATFGPTTNDFRHILNSTVQMRLPFKIEMNSVWNFRSAAAQTINLPNIATATSGANGIFSTDLNGDGGTGTGAPRGDPFPGINSGQFGRSVSSLSQLNDLITNYNTNFAGKLTPAGQALVNAGIFTQAQLVKLGAVMPTIPGIPAGTPNPWHNLFTTDVRIQRPITVKERFKIKAFADVINLFNHAPMATYAGLGSAFGSLNFNYAAAAPGQQAPDLAVSRGRLNPGRQVQIGIRLDF